MLGSLLLLTLKTICDKLVSSLQIQNGGQWWYYWIWSYLVFTTVYSTSYLVFAVSWLIYWLFCEATVLDYRLSQSKDRLFPKLKHQIDSFKFLYKTGTVKYYIMLQIERQTDRLTDGLTEWQTDWLTDRQTDRTRPTDGQTDRLQTNGQTDMRERHYFTKLFI